MGDSTDIIWLATSKIKTAITRLQPMLRTVEGIYQNGQIELTELPQNINSRVQVLVTFLEPGKIDPTKLRQLIDQLETIAGIQQGFEELERGQTRPIGDFIQEMQRKYDISGWNYSYSRSPDWTSLQLVSRTRSVNLPISGFEAWWILLQRCKKNHAAVL